MGNGAGIPDTDDTQPDKRGGHNRPVQPALERSLLLPLEPALPLGPQAPGRLIILPIQLHHLIGRPLKQIAAQRRDETGTPA